MDIANTFVGPFITKLADYTVAAVRRQLGYIFSYKKNLVDLDEKHVDLAGLREKVQNMVDVEKSKYSKIQVDVEHWLKRVNEFIELHKPKMSEDNESDPNKMSPHCLNLIQRHKLGRKAKKMVEEINEIIEKGNTFDKVGYPLPLPNIDCSSIPGYQSIASRLSLAKDINDVLADTSNSKVGIHGMGGVGKTTLVKEVERLFKKRNLLNQVITVIIGQSIDVKVIQKQMIEMLRWEFKEETEKATAALIRSNLMKMVNEILIVLDDLWNELKLEDVGIPCECKILITSRNKDVLTNEMGVETNFIFEVKSLSEAEAWEFFKNRIGEIDKNSIEPIAMKVAKKCRGLPIALDIVGKSLKGKTPRIWKDSLKQLQNPSEVKIKGVTTEVYGSLRLSYDFIQNDEAKLIFLLCSVFPDDYEIPLETLSLYAMGMRLLNGVDTLEEARNRIEALVDVLKSSSLLLEFGRINSVKMHDVVRDVAIYISSEEGSQMSTLCCGYEKNEWKEKRGSYKAIFANCDGFHNLPQDLKFPKLESLILIGGFRRKELHQIPETFFVGMEELKVLDLSRMCFPKLTTSLRNLRTLCMEDCGFRDIDIIGEFKELEVLRIHHCGIKELPKTMSQLTKLKVLYVSIVDLVSLEFGLVAQHRDNLIPFFDDQIPLPELERLVFEGASNLKMLWKNNGMISNSFCKLQRINIISCDNLRYIFPYSAMTRLVSLKALEIKRCKSLEAIFEMEETYIIKENDVALPNLSDVRVGGCPKLKSVFPASIKRLQQLQILEITGACKLFSEDKTLEIAQSNSSPFHEDQIVFPNLISLGMSYEAMKINSVTQFCRADSFPKLKSFTLYGSDDDDWISLPIGFRQLLFSTEDLQIKEVSVWKDNTDIWKMFFDHLELPDSIKLNSFPNLKSLSIEECNGLKNMLNSSVVKRLVNLESMVIKRCRGMISIVDGDGDGDEEEIMFIRLVELKLYHLERLESFHSGKSNLIFPFLEKVRILGCNNMKTFSNGIICKPMNRYFKILKEEEEEEEEEEEGL